MSLERVTYTSIVASLISVAGCSPPEGRTDLYFSSETSSGGAESEADTEEGAATNPEDSETTSDSEETSPTESVCGDGILDPGEQCDDGNQDETDACLSTCQSAYCGDGFVHAGVEVCDDGLNDGSYNGCVPGCMALASHCGDGVTDAVETCDDGNSSITDGCFPDCTQPNSCAEIIAQYPDASSGVYRIYPQAIPEGLDVYCEMTIDGGGWQLISARHSGDGVLLGDTVCLTVNDDCSGSIPVEQIGELAPEVLVATLDGDFWFQLGGLVLPGGDGLVDVLSLVRGPILDHGTCLYPHYCGDGPDPNLHISKHSESWTPRFLALPSQHARNGGLWYGNGGGYAQHHVFHLNYYSSFGLSDDSDDTLSNVVGPYAAGAIYFR